DADAAEVRVRPAQVRDVAEDADEHGGEREREEHHERLAQEQADLGADEFGERRHGWPPVSAMNASSNVDCSTRRSVATIWLRASAAVTAGTTSSLPATTTCDPCRVTAR